MKEMNNTRRERMAVWLLLVIISVFWSTLLLPVPASAAAGAKPSVYVYFENISDEPCYATLLCYPYYMEMGPLIPYYGTPESERHLIAHDDEASKDYSFEHEIWEAFVGYEDPDNYMFVQWWFNVRNTPVLDWLYLAPSEFKILLYYPERNGFAVSDSFERYAFNAYYTVDMSKTDLSVLQNGDGSVAHISSVRKSYPYAWGKEILSLLIRTLIAVGIEAGVALLFRLRERKTLLAIVLINVVTQLALNVALNIFVFHNNAESFTDFYLQMEVCVFALESIIYCLVLNRFTAKEHRQCYYVAYALAANAAAFLAGIGMAYFYPGIF